jgi:hypothetical protein
MAPVLCGEWQCRGMPMHASGDSDGVAHWNDLTANSEKSIRLAQKALACVQDR